MSRTPQSKVEAMFQPGAVVKPLQKLTKKGWKKQFQPGARLSIHDPRVPKMCATEPGRVWTELSGDGVNTIVNGWCLVNREAYFITEVGCDLLDNYEVK